MTTGIAILTLNAAEQVGVLLGILRGEEGWDKIVVFDSESRDGTASVVSRFREVEFVQINRRDFNHGATREFARKYLGTDVVVMMTQDIIPVPGFLEKLVAPLESGMAAVSYARQLPHRSADIFEAFPRFFNYGEEDELRSLKDIPKYGVYTFFCSDSCSAYLNSALDEIGGFEAVLTNEDYFAVAKLLKKGANIAYVAKACVHHSHSYTLKEEFKRYFDNGYVRGKYKWVNELVGQAEARGASMAKSFLVALARRRPWMLPYAILQLGAKWLGFRVGYFGSCFPSFWCRMFSSQPYYWNSYYYQRECQQAKELGRT